MILTSDLLAELKGSPASTRLVFAWLLSGIVSCGFGMDVPFIPADVVEVVLLVGSVGIGVAIYSWVFANEESKKKLAALSFAKRIAALSFMPFFVILPSFGNLYLISYSFHSAIAKGSVLSLTVSSTSQDIDLPGRCKYYARFSDVRFFYLRKMCLSLEEYKSIRAGMLVEVSGSQSPLGFRPTRMPANTALQGTLRDKAAQRP